MIKKILPIKAAISVLSYVLILYSQVDDVDYISIKSTIQIPTQKEVKKQQKKQEEKKNEVDTPLIEVSEDTKECMEYKVVDAFKCKDCLKFILKEQKSLHSPTHKLESVKIGIRYKCSKCGRMFVGEYTTFCPKCKERLNTEIIEVVQVQQDGEIYLVDKKSDKKICSIKSDKKEDSKKDD